MNQIIIIFSDKGLVDVATTIRTIEKINSCLEYLKFVYESMTPIHFHVYFLNDRFTSSFLILVYLFTGSFRDQL